MTDPSSARARRYAYAALAMLTIIWGCNWIVMKLALQNANPVTLNVQRTWIAVAIIFGALLVQRRRFWPVDWTAVLVTGFFQTTLNFGGTTMALGGGGAGRTSVLVFTMPFWTILLAWPVLHERLRGTQWLAVVCALVGLVFVVEPWEWRGQLAPKLWAVLSGFGWGAGTVATKFYQRRRNIDPLQFIAWQMLAGVLPLTLLEWMLPLEPTRWSITQVALTFYVAAVSTAAGFILWIAVLRNLPAGTASLNMFAIPVIALIGSRVVFGETLSGNEVIGIVAIACGLVILTLRALRGRAEEPLRDAPPAEGG